MLKVFERLVHTAVVVNVAETVSILLRLHQRHLTAPILCIASRRSSKRVLGYGIQGVGPPRGSSLFGSRDRGVTGSLVHSDVGVQNINSTSESSTINSELVVRRIHALTLTCAATSV
jgi:hypothetical protein